MGAERAQGGHGGPNHCSHGVGSDGLPDLEQRDAVLFEQEPGEGFCESCRTLLVSDFFGRRGSPQKVVDCSQPSQPSPARE